MKNVKTLIVASLMCASIFASAQRVAALGGNVGFWPEDDASWTLFPHTINNIDMMQVSGIDGEASANLVWGDETTWGFQYNEGAEGAPDWLNLGWGNGNMGVTFNLGMLGTTFEPTGGTKMENNFSSYGASFGMNQSFGEIGANFNMSSATDNDNVTEDESGMSIGFNMRRAQSVWIFDNMLVNFNMMNKNNVDGAKDATDATMDFDVDFFAHMSPQDNFTVLFAMGFGYWTNTTNSGVANAKDATWTKMTLPQVTLAVEGEFSDWATVRVGVNHSYMMGSYEDESIKNSWTGSLDANMSDLSDATSTFSMTTGLGFNFGSFNLDMTIGESVFSDPTPYFMGQNNTALSSGGVTMTYNF